MPEDDTMDLLRNLREGKTDGVDDGTTEEVEPSHAPVADLPQQLSKSTVPDVIARVLASESKSELLELAAFLDPHKKKRTMTLVFHTNVGDVLCGADWCSQDPTRLGEQTGILFVKTRKSASTFAPTEGVELDISFREHPGRIRVMCLAPVMTIYPGVDLMCFLPQDASMEKNGKLADDAPSVVSGLASDTVDDGGEPIQAHEKSASTKLAVGRGSPLRGARVDSPVIDEHEDFDVARES